MNQFSYLKRIKGLLLIFMNDIQYRLGLRGDWPELRTALAAAPTPGPLARLFHWQAL